MDNIRIRKDANGNIIDKENKNYHITISENFVTIIEVQSYKQYNLLDNNDEEEEDNAPHFMETYTPKKTERISNDDPQGFSKMRCVII